MSNNIILDKSFKFAIKVVTLYKHLCLNEKEYIMSKQLLKSGTSIGANVYEAENSQSKKDFLAKIYIAFKESAETEYWIKLLHETEYLNGDEYESIFNDCTEIKRIISSIIKTTKEK